MSIRRVGGNTVAAQNANHPATPIRKAAFQIESGLHLQSYLKMLVYGESGVGKTKLAGTALELESMHDVLLLNADMGELTLLTDYNKEILDKLASIRVNNWTQFARIYDFLKAHCTHRDTDETKLQELQNRFMPESNRLYKFKTVIIDSVTEVEAFSMSMAQDKNVDGALDEDMPDTGWGEIKQNRSNILRMARQFRDLPMNILMTAGRTMKEDESKRSFFMPDLTGSLRQQLPHYVDVVGYLVVGTLTEGENKVIKRRLHIQPVGKWLAKCRFSSFKENYFDNPTLPGIMEQVGLVEKA